MKYNTKLFGNHVKYLREFNKFTRKELSAASGVHIETIRRYEEGKDLVPKLNILESLSIHLKEDLNIILLNYRQEKTNVKVHFSEIICFEP